MELRVWRSLHGGLGCQNATVARKAWFLYRYSRASTPALHVSRMERVGVACSIRRVFAQHSHEFSCSFALFRDGRWLAFDCGYDNPTRLFRFIYIHVFFVFYYNLEFYFRLEIHCFWLLCVHVYGGCEMVRCYACVAVMYMVLLGCY
jgi:hypothetical protein